MSATTLSMPMYSLQDGDHVLASTVNYLSAACVAQYLQQSPTMKATLTMNGDSIRLPIYALRRRNAVVANLPDAPTF